MLHEFPPSAYRENLLLTIAIHVVLLVAALLPLFFVWVRTKKQAHRSELWMITAAMIFIPVSLAIVGPGLPSVWVPFVVLYALFFELVSIVALFVISRRLKAQGQATSVVNVIASLFALGFLVLCLLPATPRAREAARRMQCSNNLKMIGLALSYDETQRGSFAPLNSVQDNGPPTSWRVEMLPYLEQKTLFDSYDLASPWDSEENTKLASTKVTAFVCPSNLQPTDADGRYFTAYARPFGANVKSAVAGKIDLSQVGRSNSIAVVESCGQNIIWTEPRDALVEERTAGINLPGKTRGTSDGAISSYHTGGAQVVMLDGAVRFLSQSVDRKVLQQMLNGVASNEQLMIDE